ncbi:hypothetical protein LguiA_034754 [Lonicera macranthoides]
MTLCGHSYCWPCIYKRLQVQSSSPESDNQPNCPVCKANISKSSLVPLYIPCPNPNQESPAGSSRTQQATTSWVQHAADRPLPQHLVQPIQAPHFNQSHYITTIFAQSHNGLA